MLLFVLQAEGSLFGYSLMAVTNTALAASINDDSVTMDADQRRHRMWVVSYFSISLILWNANEYELMVLLALFIC